MSLVRAPHVLCTQPTVLYIITGDLNGKPLGYVAEEPRGFLASFGRQIFRTHRPFRALILDLNGSPLLWVGTQILTG